MASTLTPALAAGINSEAFSGKSQKTSDMSAPRDNNGAYDLADLDGTPMNFGIAEDDDVGGRGNGANGGAWNDTPMSPRSPSSDGGDMDEYKDQGSPSNKRPGDSDKKSEGPDKTLRRLAQNREAARKSRLRKKAYVQQLESSRIRLQQLEQELQRARQQGVYHGDGAAGGGGTLPGLNSNPNPGAAQFDLEYGRWVEEHSRQTSELRTAVNQRSTDDELRTLVDQCLAHYDELFKLKSQAAKMDVFHLVSGMWKTPAERCFMWMGGFRPSEMLKIIIPQVEPLTEQQLMAICNLQQSSQQAEDALSQGMESLQQSLADTLSAGNMSASSNVANYMGQMAMAMGKLGTLESFVRQADSLRQQSLQQMHRTLNIRQSAKGFLAMADYHARLRALSSLWAARPRD
eukprot:TRINITY_DN7256_c0_g1_i1.p1 TRINITY_DN7256_c0_g1~~TRINITY_DN7256_c0_g1_i1.p1  ORF type:complete len:403 (-),score=106.87 TRINITY_DN7256_c0_g1_i1:523-1731(-)